MSNMRSITATAIIVVLVVGIWSSVTHSQNQVSQSTAKNGNTTSTSSAQSQPAGMSPEEKLLRDVYTRLMRYQSAAVDEQALATKRVAQPQDYLTFELRAIHTGAIRDIYNQQVADLITPGDGQVIGITPNRRSKGKSNDPPHASYLAEWTTSAKRNGSASNPGNEKQADGTR